MHTRARSDGTRDTGSSADPLAADASAGWFRLEGVEDRCGDVIRCGENFVVPESDHSIAHQFDLLSSLTSLALRQMKSAMYMPSACCLRNLKPLMRLASRIHHMRRSAAFSFRRAVWERDL